MTVAGATGGGLRPARGGRSSARELVEAFVSEVLNGGRAEAVARLFSPAYRDHEPFLGVPPGRGGVVRLARFLSSEDVDLAFVLEESAAEGPLVAARIFGEGRVAGPLAGQLVPPGRFSAAAVQVVVSTVSLFRVAGGLLVSRWGPVSLERAVLR